MKPIYGVNYTDAVVVDRLRYIIERKYELEHLDEATDGSCPVRLYISPAGHTGYGWWSVDRQGCVTDHGLSIPYTLTEVCKIWMTSPGYQDISLVEFLTSLGVLR